MGGTIGNDRDVKNVQYIGAKDISLALAIQGYNALAAWLVRRSKKGRRLNEEDVEEGSTALYYYVWNTMIE